MSALVTVDTHNYSGMVEALKFASSIPWEMDNLTFTRDHDFIRIEFVIGADDILGDFPETFLASKYSLMFGAAANVIVRYCA